MQGNSTWVAVRGVTSPARTVPGGATPGTGVQLATPLLRPCGLSSTRSSPRLLLRQPPAGDASRTRTASPPSGGSRLAARPGCRSPWKPDSVTSSWGAAYRSIPGSSAWVALNAGAQEGKEAAESRAPLSGDSASCRDASPPRRILGRSWSCGSLGFAGSGPATCSSSTWLSDLSLPAAPSRRVAWSGSTPPASPESLAVAAPAAAHVPQTPAQSERRQSSPPTCARDEGSGATPCIGSVGHSPPEASPHGLHFDSGSPGGHAAACLGADGDAARCNSPCILGPSAGGPLAAPTRWGGPNGHASDAKPWQVTLTSNSSDSSDCSAAPVKEIYLRQPLRKQEEEKLCLVLSTGTQCRSDVNIPSVGSTASSSPVGLEDGGDGVRGGSVVPPLAGRELRTPPPPLRRGHKLKSLSPASAALAAAALAPSSPTRSDIEAALESMPTPLSQQVVSSPLRATPSPKASPLLRQLSLDASSPALPPVRLALREGQAPERQAPQLPREVASTASTGLRKLGCPPAELRACRSATASTPTLQTLTPATRSQPLTTLTTPCAATPSTARSGSSLARARSEYKMSVGAGARSDGFRESLLQKLDAIGLALMPPSPATADSPAAPSFTWDSASPASGGRHRATVSAAGVS